MLHLQIRLNGVQTFKVYDRAASFSQGGHLGTGPVVLIGNGREQRGYFIHNVDAPETALRLDRWLDHREEAPGLLGILGRQPFHQEVLSPEPLSSLELGGLQVNFDTGVFVPAEVIEKCRAGLENPKEADTVLINGLRILLQASQTLWLLPDFSELGIVTQPDRAVVTLMIEELFREAEADDDNMAFHQEARPDIRFMEEAWLSLDSLNMITWVSAIEQTLKIELPEEAFRPIPPTFPEHFRRLFKWVRTSPSVS